MRAMPKSVIFSGFVALTSSCSGLRSRCRILAPCSASTPQSSIRMYALTSASRSAIDLSLSTSRRSVSIRSSTRYTFLSCMNTSWSSTTFSWRTSCRSLISRRVTNEIPSVSSFRRTLLSAYKTPVALLRARYTSPN
eukprot:Amastigsp_a845825_4.p2 type:complete len:137 gc:universal Amastigsp_a845825_4:590-1000(+)